MMPRVIPCLTIDGHGVVKTVQFKAPAYLGDPRNAVRIFNEREVDELVVLDIRATEQGRAPDFPLIGEIVSEAFMPVAYGGGITTADQARRLLNLGVEKVVLGTRAITDPSLVEAIAKACGSQSVMVCLDVKRRLFGGPGVWVNSGRHSTGISPATAAAQAESRGAGEIVVNSIDRDGTRKGFDLELIRSVSDAVSVPVVACGGAGSLQDLRAAVVDGGASAVAAGSLFVQHGRYKAALVSYPDRAELQELFR